MDWRGREEIFRQAKLTNLELRDLTEEHFRFYRVPEPWKWEPIIHSKKISGHVTLGVDIPGIKVSAAVCEGIKELRKELDRQFYGPRGRLMGIIDDNGGG